MIIYALYKHSKTRIPIPIPVKTTTIQLFQFHFGLLWEIKIGDGQVIKNQAVETWKQLSLTGRGRGRGAIDQCTSHFSS